MCGIAGIVEFEAGRRADPAALRQMCAAMVHRGPDDEGVYVEECVGLGMRRLSIIDLVSGHQPMTNEDGSIRLVYNGEIYNQRALRERLAERGHLFRTQCDTETIVHAYEEFGRDCVNHLRGMFAFALWDTRRRRLFAARDRLGIKPFYYRRTPERFLFGSEIKVILAHPGLKPEFNPDILSEYLAFGYLSGPETFYQGVHKLMPGHTLELDEHGQMSVEPYWDLAPPPEQPARTERDYVDAYRGLLEEAIRSHLMSDVPLGVFLSGGVDSSAVAALMTRIRGGPVETFSVGYSESTYSELPYAQVMSDHLKSIHHEVKVNREEFFGALPKLIWHEDEPIVWPSSVALYFVARRARERVTVVLTGEGSDECLAGYTRYSFTLKNAAFDRVYRRLVPAKLRGLVRRQLAESPLIGAKLRRNLAHTFLAQNGDSWASFYFDNFFAAFSEDEQAKLLADDAGQAVAPGSAYRSVLDYWERSAGSPLRRLLYTDIKTYLVELLMKQDNMSMAASIESRVPFLDHVLVEFATSIPQRFQVRGLKGKRILKKAVEDLLPRSILYRPKLGFPTPWGGWLAGPHLDVIERLLLEPRSVARGLFRREAVERLFREHRASYRDHYERIWRLLNLELWFRVCIEGEPHAESSAGQPLNAAQTAPSFSSA
jgi:asparagine synthase (glutamine-hydrolysing)